MEAGLGVALVPAAVLNPHVTGTEYRPITGGPHPVGLAVALRAGAPSPLAVGVRDHVPDAGRRLRPTSAA